MHRHARGAIILVHPPDALPCVAIARIRDVVVDRADEIRAIARSGARHRASKTNRFFEDVTVAVEEAALGDDVDPDVEQVGELVDEMDLIEE